MNKKSGRSKSAADKLVKNIRRKSRQTYSAEEKIRVVLAGLRGEESISALCRREGNAEACITVGRRSSLRRVNAAYRVIQLVRRRHQKSKSCVRNL